MSKVPPEPPLLTPKQNRNSHISGSKKHLSYTVIYTLFLILSVGVVISGAITFHKCSIGSLLESLPIFFIEAVTTSYIDISSTTFPSSLSAQDLTIDFIVENPASRRVEYRNAEVLISYKGEIIWVNTLGLYHLEKKDHTSIQAAFGNFPVNIRDIDNVMITSGYGIFTVQVKANISSNIMLVSCGDVRINFRSSTKIQGDQRGLPLNCTTHAYYSPKYVHPWH